MRTIKFAKWNLSRSGSLHKSADGSDHGYASHKRSPHTTDLGWGQILPASPTPDSSAAATTPTTANVRRMITDPAIASANRDSWEENVF